MFGTEIRCETCGLIWPVARLVSVYEQQDVETRPCPSCGTHTLCCRDAMPTAARRAYRRKAPPLGGPRAGAA